MAAAAKIEERVCEDMISALTDDLLVTILLLLPIKDAVATMILSKRWRFVWTMLPILEYEENGYSHDFSFYHDDNGDDDDTSKKSIWGFFEKSMELLKAPVLRNLLITLGPGCPSDADVGKCLTKAVDRRVVVLKFRLCWSTGPTRLPNSLYTCETLKELTLSHKFLVDFPSSSCLPSLDRLELYYVVYKDEASLVRFLSSCPVLRILIVKRNKNHNNVTKFSVKVPSLECFVYDNSDQYSLLLADNDVVDTGRSLVIDTPALKEIDITDYSRDSLSIENIPCLETACIDVLYFPDIDKSKTSLSRVLSLTLYMTDELGGTTVTFTSKCSSNLLIDNTLSYKDLVPLSWNQPSSIPECMSSNLEIFEYKRYGDREEEKEFLTYVLANSKCLKTVTISVSRSFALEKKELIIEKLRTVSRAEDLCQDLRAKGQSQVDSVTSRTNGACFSIC